ncbi:arsenic resistance N-acetyltransferase ArsN2 [Lysobacter solisilvae (ex Woo and Kim 2020)]|uniref:GNAT family N-acetyltransferase n=1 Tax=Agrilutibacter terrestris TaxID=2865112 RepID=A0A7H0FWZ0_9GAMM|nr:arsenic resistance N-acetyltransferase ArsN2 [Lysobacter terrestris]QNP40556.1 GNAT family N-acetyltransferase [Lysobacter terrestris]
MPMELRPSTRDEGDTIRALLIACDLPVADFDTAAIEFTMAMDDQGLAGVVGLETFEATGLLRSLAVRPSARASGTGSQLVQALEAQARAKGLERLVLLTQTAESFFARRGYDVIERGAAPVAVQGSAEFRSICPASAVCMSKSLF